MRNFKIQEEIGVSNAVELVRDEQVIMTSDNDALVLTSERVRYKSKVWGYSEFTSITLASVASCGIKTKSHPILLILAAALFVFAFAERNLQLYLILFSMILVIAYFMTRRAVLSISSNGGESIVVPIKNMKLEVVTRFVDALEDQKLK